MNKEIDWHGQVTAYVVKDWDKPRPTFRLRDVWERPRMTGGAYPRDAECPVGWDERDALV